MVGAFLMLAALMTQAPASSPPGRPLLSGRADINDWQAYFDKGAEILQRYPNRADSMFHWAHRLDPSRAEPLYARWVTFWLKDIGRFEEYLDDDARVLESAEVIAADSLFLRAMQRNPLVPRPLVAWLFNALPGSWDDNPATRGWLAYSKRQYPLAASYFGQMTRSNNERYVWFHLARALTFMPDQQFDSATTEMNTLLARLRASMDTQRMQSIYESQEIVTYAIGLLQIVRGLPDSARRSFERAVEENLAFFPAHMELGELALGRFNRGAAERSFRQAAELAPNEAWVQERLGAILLRMGKSADALVPLERAIQLEPYYAESYWLLAKAWEGAGDKTAAIKAYQQYLERAPRRDTTAINDSQRRLAALRTSP